MAKQVKVVNCEICELRTTGFQTLDIENICIPCMRMAFMVLYNGCITLGGRISFFNDSDLSKFKEHFPHIKLVQGDMYRVNRYATLNYKITTKELQDLGRNILKFYKELDNQTIMDREIEFYYKTKAGRRYAFEKRKHY